MLDDAQVQGMQILPDAQAAFVKAIAPLDVQVGETFRIAVVVTDRYGNPRPLQGSVMLAGGVETEVAMNGGWRSEIEASLGSEGAHRIVASLPGARSIWHWVKATAEPPAVHRLLGDIHIHTGDGGAQRKFIGSFLPGDHAALYSRTRDTLGFLERVSGYDFGAVSERSVRGPADELPPAVAADPAFQPGGARRRTASPRTRPGRARSGCAGADSGQSRTPVQSASTMPAQVLSGSAQP